jgi:hypothetical protein
VIRLLAEIERILLREWDPIGVNDCPGASDEYDSYAFEIYTMMHAATPASAHEIAAYLGKVQSEHMELDLTPELNDEVAAMIVRLQGI